MLTLNDIKWAAEECERQESGEMSVSHLCNALHFARGFPYIIDELSILLLGRLVEPEKNKDGFRRVPVRFINGSMGLAHDRIPSAIESLLQHGNDLTPELWYKEFQLIHPFLDGNGRVGAILFNYRNDTISNPIAPPKVF